MLQAIVLDFDGVIVNSEPLHLRAFQAVLAEEGTALNAHDYYARYVGLDDDAAFRAVARDRGLPISDGQVAGLIARKTVRVQAMLADSTPLFPGAAERMREFAEAVPLAVASGALRHEIIGVLESAGLARFVGAVVAAGETPRGKPAPDPYRRAVDLLSECTGDPLEPSRVVAIEDTLQGLHAARAAGLRTVAVTTTYPATALQVAELIVPDLAAATLSRLRAGLDWSAHPREPGRSTR
jgi:beta-phosphoglucomutase